MGKARVKSQPDTEFYSLARQKLEEVMQPDQQRLTDLAIARAHAISQYLTEKCQLDARRVYILAPEVKLTTNDGIIAILSLNAAE